MVRFVHERGVLSECQAQNTTRLHLANKTLTPAAPANSENENRHCHPIRQEIEKHERENRTRLRSSPCANETWLAFENYTGMFRRIMSPLPTASESQACKLEETNDLPGVGRSNTNQLLK